MNQPAGREEAGTNADSIKNIGRPTLKLSYKKDWLRYSRLVV